MIKQRVGLSLIAIVAAALIPSVANAQSIYKCPTHGGGYEYTDMPCAGPRAVVVHKATAGEIAAKQDADDRQVMLSMLRSGQVELAKRYAVSHHQESLYDSIVASLVQDRAEAEQRRQQQAELARQQRAQAVANKIHNLSVQNQELRQVVNAQSDELDYQEQRARAAQNAAINAHNAAIRAQLEAQEPHFNPQSGQMCQTIGGTVVCN